ncbi:MAG: STT3 domain-containing protein [Desulfurococcaceae archaeon]
MNVKYAIRRVDSKLLAVISGLSSQPLRLKLVIGALILVAVMLGVVIRVAPFKLNEYEFFEFDSYIEYWQAAYVHEHGPLAWYTLTRENPDTHIFWYPWGRDFIYTSYPFLPIWTGMTYHIVKHFSLDLHQWTALQPVIFAAIATVAAYLAATEASGSRLVGVLAALFYAVLPAAVERSVIGYVEKEGVAAVFVFLFVYFYARCLKTVYSTGKGWFKYTVLAALFLAMVGWLWGGYVFLLGTVVLYFVLSPILVRKYLSRSFITCNILLILLTMLFVTPSPANARTLGIYPFSPRGLSWLLVGASMLPVIFYYAGMEYRKMGFRKPVLNTGRYILLVGGLLIAGVVFTAMGILPIGGRLAWALGLRFIGAEPLVESIAEHQSPLTSLGTIRNMLHSWGTYFIPLAEASPELAIVLGILYLLSAGIVGIVYLLYEGTPEKVYVGVAFGVSFYSYLNAVYMIGAAAYFGVIIIAAIVALVANKAFPYVIWLTARRRGTRAARRTTTEVGTATRIITLILLVAIFTNFAYTAKAEYEGNSAMVYTFRAGVSGLAYLYSDSWYKTVDLLRSLPENSVVIAWWDYGYGISVPGGRISVADGSTLNNTQIGIIGLLMWSNTTDQAAHLAKLFNVKPNETYLMIIEGVLVSEQNDTVAIWPIVDFGQPGVLDIRIPGLVDWPKSMWMFRIGNSVVDELRRKGINVNYIDSAEYMYAYTAYAQDPYSGRTALELIILCPPLSQPERTPLIYRLVVDGMLYWAETRGKKGIFYWFSGSEQAASVTVRNEVRNRVGINVSKEVPIMDISNITERPLINDTILQPHAVIAEPFIDPNTGKPLELYTPDRRIGILYSVIIIYKFTYIP